MTTYNKIIDSFVVALVLGGICRGEAQSQKEQLTDNGESQDYYSSRRTQGDLEMIFDNPFPEDLFPKIPTPSPFLELFPRIPTDTPIATPTSSLTPTVRPSESPSTAPSISPSTSAPTLSMLPTAPTSEPSDMPSSEPSTSPTDYPTVSPQPSATPSVSPTDLPSIEPSQSIQPSGHPSKAPTLSAVPSEIPSDAPSQVPTSSSAPTETASSSPTLSVQPSEFPSLLPSIAPTNSLAPSLQPSSAPSLSVQPTVSSAPSLTPSISPTDLPSVVPTLSLVPSAQPSGSPSTVPSLEPSSIPSSMPSGTPSSMPSETPSSLPSSAPSAYPTSTPSYSPSGLPSTNPSTSPSTMPSWQPTLTCHDIADYRSPINDLTCDDHQGTDCLQWRFLGLNTTELGNLIESCPETCDIECNSFNQYFITVTFRLSGIPGILDDGNIKTLEDAALEFVVGVIQFENPDLVFELDEVTLKGQEEKVRETRTRFRRLQQENTTVDVSVLFTGFALNKTNAEISDLIIDIIEEDEFDSILRETSPFYSTVIITSATGTAGIGPVQSEKTREGASGATIAVSSLVSASIMCFALGSFVYHSRSGRWVPWSTELRVATREDIDDDIICRSPISNAHSSIGDVGSPRNSLLSFDTATGSGMQGQGGANVPSSSTLVRLMASLSLSPRSDSNSSTQEDTSVSASEGSPPKGNDERKGSPPPLISPMSEASEDSDFQEHPLASVIPPMIVIDNLDDDGKEECGFEAVRKKQQVPSKHVEASSDLLSALKGSSSQEHSNSFRSQSILLESSELNMSTWKNNYDNRSGSPRPLSPIGIVDSDSDDETSVASTPVRQTTPPAPLRRTLSSSALESVDRRKSPDMLLSKPMEFVSPHSLSPKFHDDSEIDEQWDYADGNDNSEDQVDIAFRLGSPPPTKSAERPNLPPIHSSVAGSTSERPSMKANTRPSDGLLNSLWSLSPISKAFKESAPSTTTKPPSFPKRSSSNPRLPSAEFSDLTDEEISSRRVETIGSDLASAEKLVRHEFETPRKGQLGLVLEATKDGPVVRAIKDYSPLFGLVKVGDKLVEVDGKKTVYSTVNEVTKLLSVRPNRRSSHVRIAVTRPFHDSLETLSSASPRHSRGSSHGSETDDLLRATNYSHSDHSRETLAEF